MASELEYSYPVIENTVNNDSAPKSLPPEKVFVIAVVVILIAGAIIYGISNMIKAPSDYQKLDLNSKKSSTQNEQVAGSSVVGPYGKPNVLPTPTPTQVPSPTEAPQENTSHPTATPTNKPDPTSTPTPTPTVTPTFTPAPTASPSGTITPTGTE
ncbi:MAG TPA: hypothetical protein VLF20_03390 [Patescibacteria group bacterium]|nr:hypothetical protein [Patescibacteria group bacterium]